MSFFGGALQSLDGVRGAFRQFPAKENANENAPPAVGNAEVAVVIDAAALAGEWNAVERFVEKEKGDRRRKEKGDRRI